jgi:acyl dehydratase
VADLRKSAEGNMVSSSIQKTVEIINGTEICISRNEGKPLILLTRMASRGLDGWDRVWGHLSKHFSVAQFDLEMPSEAPTKVRASTRRSVLDRAAADAGYFVRTFGSEVDMVAMAKVVGERRYRESYGRYFEDFAIGDVYEHRPGRTITDADNIWFSLLTNNQHPLHSDAAYSSKSEFGKLLVDSCITLSVVTGLSVADVSAKAIANLGWDKVKLTAPVFAGDTIYAESEVLEKRQSKSRPTQGIVTVRSTGKNQNGVVCITFERTLLIPLRGHALDDKINY